MHGPPATKVSDGIGHLADAVESGRTHTGAMACARQVGDASSAPIRVLVVEDDPRVRESLAQTIALEADLVVVATAAGAVAALTLAERTDPSVALVDVLLPDSTTGLALVRSLAQRPGCAVVAMSVRSGLRAAAEAAGSVDFVEKSGDIDALLRVLRAAGRHRRV